MTKSIFRRLLTCVAAAFVCIGLLVPADQAEAADYWVYTDARGAQYYVSSTKTNWPFRSNTHDAYVTSVYTNNQKRAEYWSFCFDEGQTFYSVDKSGTTFPVYGNPVAEAVLDFCQNHWGRYGFHE